MPQASNLPIADGQATPVTQTFAVEQATPALSSFADRSAGVSAGFRRIKLSNKFASSRSPVNRAKLTLECPALQVINGISTVANTTRASVEFIFPDNATELDRKNAYAFVRNALANASVQSALRDLDPMY